MKITRKIVDEDSVEVSPQLLGTGDLDLASTIVKKRYLLKSYVGSVEELARVQASVETVKKIVSPHVPMVQMRVRAGDLATKQSYPNGIVLSIEQLILQSVKFSPDQLLAIFEGYIRALSAIHELGCIHGNLNASNLMVNLNKQKSMIVSYIEDLGSVGDRWYQSQTSIYTPSDLKERRSADTWSLGVALWGLVTLTIPKDGVDIGLSINEDGRINALLDMMLNENSLLRPTAIELLRVFNQERILCDLNGTSVSQPELLERAHSLGLTVSSDAKKSEICEMIRKRVYSCRAGSKNIDNELMEKVGKILKLDRKVDLCSQITRLVKVDAVVAARGLPEVILESIKESVPKKLEIKAKARWYWIAGRVHKLIIMELMDIDKRLVDLKKIWELAGKQEGLTYKIMVGTIQLTDRSWFTFNGIDPKVEFPKES